MAHLEQYASFQGYHPVTAAVGNALAHAGVGAPHRDGPLSEALLAGVAGGICLGYFFFAYEGRPPQVNLVTRYSFGEYGWEPLQSRLGFSVDVRQTTSADKGRQNLVEALEEGAVPIVWLDTLRLGYETSELGEDMWMVTPAVVYSYEDDEARIADRADAPIIVSADSLDAARSRIKKERFRVVTLDRPDLDGLPSAVEAGIRDTLSMYTEKPPKGSANSWGKKALMRWQELLRSERGKASWKSTLASPAALYAGLTTAYKYGFLYWKDGSETADRALFADFLEEAASILGKPALSGAAIAFNRTAAAWKSLAGALLPEDIPILAESRSLMHRRHIAFLSRGSEAMAEIRDIDSRLSQLEHDGPNLDVGNRQAFQEHIADAVAAVEQAETNAMEILRDAVS